ncbi:hypothetical protein [Almyronema epifaneia]|uniref:hypothetical protein n=1 Tax=Almyronema epifaneia TaxID=3114805 RepID=UPI0036717C88
MTSCPYCSSNVLRHIRHNKVYWFCQHCWQEVPELSQAIENKRWQPSAVLTTHCAQLALPQRVSLAI